MTSIIDVIGESIVNPKCDDCGASLSTPRPGEIGFPRQCGSCQRLNRRRFAAMEQDWISQERPRNRRIHVVKLPEGMCRGRE